MCLDGRHNPVRTGELSHHKPATALIADQPAEHGVSDASHWR
jgi:hypothetical protein